MLIVRTLVFSMGAFVGVVAHSAAFAQEAPDAATPPAAEPTPGDPPADAPAAESRLQFRFSRTRWIDVLEWLADRSDLSLQLESPPPGSFNYSDTKEYTPVEAIDVVNSRLAMIGYTLVRRDRMLVLVDLKGGVPRALLPEVTLDELDQRGDFEFVSVKFPIEGRPMEAIVAEVKVLLGPFGDVAALPGSGQVLVSDRASIMRTVHAVIQKIPRPSGPKPKPKPKEPEKQELRVYQLAGADAAAVLETLKTLFESAKCVHDPEADTINAFTTPTQHAAIEQIFQQIRGGGPEGNRPRLETYPLPDLDAAARESFLGNLALVAPSATQRYDEEASRLFIWAKPIEHEAIRSAVVKLLQVAPLAQTRQLRVYSLVRTDPTTLGTLLETTLPRVKITVDTTGRRLIVHATADEHTVARQLIEQIDAEPSEEQRPILRIYAVDRQMADRISTLVQRFAPDAEVTIDPRLGRASVVATAADHERIEPLLTKLSEAAAGLPAPTVETFKVPRELRGRFEFIRTLLEAEVPNAKLLWNAESSELTVWARAEEHLQIGTFLDQMGRHPPSEPPKKTVVVLQVPRELRDRFEAVQALLTAEIPEAKLTWNPDALELTVWATTKEHARVLEVFEQVKKQPASHVPKPTFKVHQLPRTLRDRFQSIEALLTAEVPEAKLTWDPKSLELTVWAMAHDHARIREVLEQIEKQPLTPPTQPTVEVHTVPDELRGRFESIRTLFDTEVPDARLLWNAEDGELTVWAMEADHARIGELIDQMSRQPPANKRRQLVAYPLDRRDPSTVVTMLQNIAKDAQITADTEGRRILVWATAEEHEAIGKAVKQLGGGDQPLGARSFMSHPVKGLDLALASRLLIEQFPGITFEQDTARTALITFATPKEHQQIAAAIQAMQTEPQNADSRRAVVYPTDATSSEAVARVLTDMLPGAHIVGERNVPNVSVRGTDAEHELAKAVVDQWNKNRRDLDQPVAKVYTLKSVQAESARAQLVALVPTAYFAVGSIPSQLLVRAAAEEHELIGQLVEQIDQPGEEGAKVVVVYKLPGGDLTSLQSLLDAKTAAEIQSVSGGKDRVIIRATPEVHARLKVVIDQLVPVISPRPYLVSYTIEHADPTTLATFFRGAAPGTQIIPDMTRRRLLIWGTDDDHQLLSNLIEQIDTPEEAKAKIVAVYELPGGDLTSLNRLLDPRTVAEIQSVSGGRNRVIIRATPAIHEKLKVVIGQLKPVIDPDPRMVIYKIKHADPSSLTSLVRGSAPGAQIIPDTPNRQLLIWGTDDDHELLTRLIEQIDQPSKDDAKVVAVYELPGGNLSSLSGLLDARTSQELQSVPAGRNRVIVRATPEYHQKLQAVIDEVGPTIDPDLRIAIYRLHQADPLIVSSMIRTVAPEAVVTEDTKRRRLVIRGTEEDHLAIAKVIEDLGGDEAGPDERSFLSHPVKRLDLTMASRLLGDRFPSVTFEQDPQRTAVVALATAEQHKQISQTLREMQTAPKEDVDRRVVIYPTDPSSSESVAEVLSDLLPNASVVGRRSVPNVSVRGTDEEHALAQKVVEQWNRNRRELDGRTPKVYHLKTLSANQIRRELYRLVPSAYFAVGPTANQVLARATAEEHELIARLLEQIDTPAAADNKVVAVYELPGGDLTSLQGLLDERMTEEIQTVSGGGDRVIVRATPELQTKVKAVIDQLTPALGGKPLVEVYRFQHATALEGARVVRQIAPEAQIVLQPESQSLAVAAVKTDHDRIAAAVEQIERSAEKSDADLVSVVPVLEADPQNLVTLLQSKYANEPEWNFSYDMQTRSILVVGPARRHDEIKTIIEAADAAKAGRDQKVAVYPLGRISGYIARQLVTELIAKEPDPGTITLEPNGNQLVVVANERQQNLIREALLQLKPKETEFEVFTLEVLDPGTADFAISGLFSSLSEGGTPPIVDADRDNYRLYVRGTAEQLVKIRELLTKMGETALDGPSNRLPQSKMRFIPLGGDAESAIDAIRNVWPRLRKNELRVLGPDSSRMVPGRHQPLQPPRGRPAGGSTSGGEQKPQPASGDTGWQPVRGLHGLDPVALFGQVTVDEQPLTKERPQADDGGPPPPVFIIPGERGVTLMSEDAEALEQLERLLTVVARPQPRGGRRLTVYALNHADANRLATELNRFYRSIPTFSRGRSGRVAFAADERLNAIVVHASRADQREIEELLDILDSELSADMQATNRPVVIPLKNARAEVVEEQLRVLYKTQLSAGGKQPMMEIPSGADPIVAAMMQQVNAIRQGPLMTIEIDADTNSLLLIAPPSLVDEVRTFADDLDRAAAEHPRRAVRILPLKEINATEMDRALERIFRNRRSRGRRR